VDCYSSTNSDFEYPIKLGGVECVKADLVTCTAASTTTCCKEMLSPSSNGPYEVIMQIIQTVYIYIHIVSLF
jgi:hypothetical protein